MTRLHPLTALWGLVLMTTSVGAEIISDVRNTKHNFSISGPGPVTATSESQVCVFCHTPHAAEQIPGAPLWNRKASTATYTPYTSSSIDANDIAATPGGTSKLCLSCHDGTIAIGNVNVANGQPNVQIELSGTGPGGVMPSGHGDNTGFTRKLGTDLANDHPISFTYNTDVATADGELRDPASVQHIANRSPGVKPLVPLENDKLECNSCHDPHIRDVDLTKNIKFLRLNRFQENAPVGGAFNQANDIVCLACHDKLGQAWATSAHADPSAADETYSAAAAALRDFPANQPVWKASCLNCHDTHTVQGARRLLREGTDSPASPKTGGNAAQEEACFTCHSADGGVLNGQGGVNFQVPNIKTDFNATTHMPITNADQNKASEVHDITNADLIEDPANFDNGNRHVECTDCHNPHRVTKNELFNGTGSNIAGTHRHEAGHTNIASGVLRGTWGVEPSYLDSRFSPNILPSLYQVKSGDGGFGASDDINSTYVTREYQVCFKCHSDYAYGTLPPLRGSTGGNTSTAQSNGLSRYTNQAMEFQAPAGHDGEGPAPDTGADAQRGNNHRSWHPVMKPTGRTLAEKRTAQSQNWLTPFNGAADIGNQTMYCSDCHGSATANGTAVPNGGTNGAPWGPHGSNNKYILKGDWDTNTGNTNSQNDICFKCHNYQYYATENQRGNTTGFCCGDGRGNLHAYHAGQFSDRNKTVRCMWCHIAVPHGWKNKALLVNLNDVGPEVGLAPGTEVRSPDGGGYNNGPYYQNAKLKVRTFANSGQWNDTNCGSDGLDGETGKKWMQDTCKNPP
jgi:hypothetical protein